MLSQGVKLNHVNAVVPEGELQRGYCGSHTGSRQVPNGFLTLSHLSASSLPQSSLALPLFNTISLKPTLYTSLLQHLPAQYYTYIHFIYRPPSKFLILIPQHHAPGFSGKRGSTPTTGLKISSLSTMSITFVI